MSSTNCSIGAIASLVWVGCTGTSPVPDSGTEPDPDANVVLLGDAGTLYGAWTARLGSDLAFFDDGRLLIGAPSFPHSGESSDQEDDRCWLAEHGAGLVSSGPSDEGGALLLNDLWDDDGVAPDISPSSGNRFGLAVLAPGDITGDGIPDIIVGEPAHFANSTLRWGLFPGPEHTEGFPMYFQRGSDRAAPCGDLDGDGIAELCTGEGVFFGPIDEQTRQELSWSAEDPHLTATDLDGDGTRELLVSDAATSSLYRLDPPARIGQTSLPDIAHTTWTAGTGHVTALAAGDLDGDGDIDLVAGWSDDGGDVVLVGLSDGGGSLLAGVRTTLAVRADELAVGDFDGDGQGDLAVGGASEVTVWLGPLSSGKRTALEADARYRGLQYPNDQLGSALAAGDSDSDGKAELAIGAPMDAFPEEPCGESCWAPGRVWWLDTPVP